MDLAESLGSTGARTSQSLLDSVGQHSEDLLVRAVLAELSAGKTRTVLAIDDAHELLGKPAQKILQRLLSAQPDGLAYIFSSRVPLGPLVSSALLEGRLHRFGIRELAFSAGETAALLGQHRPSPRKAVIDEVHKRTQGWPAAVRLVALLLGDDGAVEDRLLVEALEGDSQLISDYLNDTVITRMPAGVYKYLLALSLIPSFTPALAGAVTGCGQPQAMLEDLGRRGLPIARGWSRQEEYVLHPLLRSWLLKRLQSGEHPFGDLLNETYARAYAWLIETGDLEKAIEVCVNAGDPDQAARLIDSNAHNTARQYGRHGTYLYWTNKLPQDVLAGHPEIRLNQAWSLNFLRRWEEADAIRSSVQEQMINRQAQDAFAGVKPGLIYAGIELQNCVKAGLRDQAMACVSATQKWLSRWPQASVFDRAVGHILLAFSMKSLSQFSPAFEHVRNAQTLCRKSQAPYMQSWACMLAVTILTKQGRYQQALDECRLAITELEPALGAESPAVTMLHVMLAGLLYEFNRLGEARDALGHGLTALMEQSSADPIIVGYVTMARLQYATGEHLAALQTLAEGEAACRARELPRAAICLGAERIILLLRSGEYNQAQRQWEDLQRFSSMPGAAEPWLKVLEDKAGRIHSRMALLQGNTAAAIEFTDEALAHARASGQKRKQVELLLLRALALYENEPTPAMDSLRQALEIALSEGYVRSLLDEGARLRPLLESHLQHKLESVADEPGPGVEYVRQLLGALDEAASPAPISSKGKALRETLTARERQILFRLQSGPDNRRLADALFITEGTLKWHLTNIYAKLGVKSRLAAIATAKDLDLFEET